MEKAVEDVDSPSCGSRTDGPPTARFTAVEDVNAAEEGGAETSFRLSGDCAGVLSETSWPVDIGTTLSELVGASHGIPTFRVFPAVTINLLTPSALKRQVAGTDVSVIDVVVCVTQVRWVSHVPCVCAVTQIPVPTYP